MYLFLYSTYLFFFLYKLITIYFYVPRHDFHKSCIDPWLLEHRTCPMCKMDILKHYGFVVGSQNQNNLNTSSIQNTVTFANSNENSSSNNDSSTENNSSINNTSSNNSNSRVIAENSNSASTTVVVAVASENVMVINTESRQVTDV